MYYVGWLLAGLEWNSSSGGTVYTVPPDDEQVSAQNMYRLLIIINCKQTVHPVGPVVLVFKIISF
jgi:hypothetical protein